jgi:hypothetical protein
MLTIEETDDLCTCTLTDQYLKTKKLGKKKNLVLFSGGIDSQALCLYLTQNKIEYETLFADYGHNKNDLIYTKILGRTHTYNIDLDEFYFTNRLHIKYWREYHCTSPQIAVHLHIILYALEKFQDYNILMPSRPLMLWRKLPMYPDYNELAYQRFKNIEKVNNFYPYFFINFDVAEKAKNLNIHTNDYCNDYTKKFLAYHELGLRVTQQDLSFTGFENYKIYLKESKKLVYDTVLRKPVDTQKILQYIDK